MSVLKYDISFYLPSVSRNRLRGAEFKQVRSEYSRLRKIAKKRLAAFERTAGSKLDLTKSQSFKSMTATELPKLKDVSIERLPYVLNTLARWISKPTSSVTGLRRRVKQTITSLHASGYDFVNETNIFDFSDFMEEFRAQKLDHIIGSPTAADLFMTVSEKGLDPAGVYSDFMFWLENQKKLENMPVIKNGAFKKYRLKLKKDGHWKN